MRFRESEQSKKMAEVSGEFEWQCEEEEILLLLLLLRHRRRHGNLIRELNAEDPEQFRQYHHLSQESFHQILAMVSPLLSKQDTHLRMAIKPSERLSVALRFLATGL